MMTVQLRKENRYASLKLPCKESEMEEALRRIREGRASPPEPLISKVAVPRELSVLENRYVNLDELNYLAKRLESFSRDELWKFYAAAVYEEYADMENLINLTFNLQCYTLIRDVSSLEAVGRTYLLDIRQGIVASEFETADFSAIGRELLSNEKLMSTAHGLLYKNGIRMERIYDGQTFPCYSHRGDWLITVSLEYHGRTEYVFLPEEEAAIQKALDRLGASYPEECQKAIEDISIDNWEWHRCLEEVLRKEELYELNELVSVINTADMDLEKLAAVIQYAEVNTALEMTRLAQNIDAFVLIKDVADFEDIGRFAVSHYSKYRMDRELEEYFMYEKLGAALAEGHEGDFVEGRGYVYLEDDRSLEDILNPDRNMELGGIRQ